MHSAFFEAAEAVVEFYAELEAALDIETPPKEVLSDREQVDFYLQLIAQPELARAFEALKGKETFADWAMTMEHKAALLGMADARIEGEINDDGMDDLLASQLVEIERGG